jgi:hypothetical protein
MVKDIPKLYAVAGLVLAAGVLYIAVRGPRDVGRQVGSGAADLIAGAVEGAGGEVWGYIDSASNVIMDALHMPRIDQTECEKAKASGDTMAAGFSCGFTDFYSWWWNK